MEGKTNKELTDWVEKQKTILRKRFKECVHEIIHVKSDGLFVEKITIYCKKCGRIFKK